MPLNKTNAFFCLAFSLETHILNCVCFFLLFCMCFTGVFLENKHFVREWGQRHQKGTPKAPQNHPQNETSYSKFRVCFSYKKHVFCGCDFRKRAFRSRVGPKFKKEILCFFSFCSKTRLQRGPPNHTKIEKNHFGAYLKTV